MRSATLILTAALSGCAGADLPVSVLPELVADPPALRLAPGNSGIVSVTNAGEDAIRVDRVEGFGSVQHTGGLEALPVTIEGGDTVFVELTGAPGRGVLLLRGVAPTLEARLAADDDLEAALAWRPPARDLILGAVDETATDDVYLSMLHVTRYVGETTDVYNLVRSAEPGACGETMVPADAWTDWTYAFTVEELPDGVVSTVITARLACDFTTPETEGWAEQVWWSLDGLRRAE